MAQLDDLTAKGDATGAIGHLLAALRTLLSPVEGDDGFAGRYDQALQRDADVMLYHGIVSKLLAAAGNKGEET